VLLIILSTALSGVLSFQTPVQSPGSRQAMPPSTMSNPIYVTLPVTIEIANMAPQVVADLVASGKLAVDGAHHLNIPQGPMGAMAGLDMLRPSARPQEIPTSSSERPLKVPANQTLVVSAPRKFVLVTAGKIKLTVLGNRLTVNEIR